MDLLHQYADDQNDDDPSSPPQNPSSPDSSSSPPRILPGRSAAPSVDDTMLALTVQPHRKTLSNPIDPTQHNVAFNPTYDQLWAPIQGPSHPYAKDGIAQGLRNHKLGFVEDAAIDPFLFDEQYNTFHKFGYAADPSASNYVGDFDALTKNNAVSVYNIPRREQKRRKTEKKEGQQQEEGEEGGIDGDDDVDEEGEVENPASETWLVKNKKSPWFGKKEGLQGELTEEQRKYAEEYAKKKGEEKGGFGGEKAEAVKDKSTFHG